MEAPKSIVCEDCRNRWTRYHDEQGKYIEHTPVGYVKLFLADATQPLICRSYADVRAHIVAMEEGKAFHVELIAFMLTVGHGMYVKYRTKVTVLSETGACEGLSLSMREAKKDSEAA